MIPTNENNSPNHLKANKEEREKLNAFKAAEATMV
jgi:hypothetical protein